MLRTKGVNRAPQRSATFHDLAAFSTRTCTPEGHGRASIRCNRATFWAAWAGSMKADADDEELELEPALLMARAAIASGSGRRLVLHALAHIARSDRARLELIRRTGMHICRLAGAKVLRRVAEEAARTDRDIGAVVHDRLLDGFWRA
jgi:hypothetical protein